MKISKQDRFLAKARNRLQDELEIVSILRQLRYVKAAISTLITPHRVIHLKQENDRHFIGKVKKDANGRIELASGPDTTQNFNQSFSQI